MNNSAADDHVWLAEVEQRIESFAERFSFTYDKTPRHLAASFEVGCFLALVSYYERQAMVQPMNLTDAGEYRYLTSPQGNPHNFSFVEIAHPTGRFHLRQQVRIRSHFHEDIAFTPDFLVLSAAEELQCVYDRDYASGRQRFWFVESTRVVAAHECKSLAPFPELLVSFLGLVMAAHSWLDGSEICRPDPNGLHFAPTLFVGGSAKALHNRMVRGLCAAFPINVVLGLHQGTWDLRGAWRRVTWNEER
jgi:hypothetical protein